MPNIGPVELIIVLVIVLVIFGARRVPEAGKNLGKGMREFKDAITGKGDDREELETPTTGQATAPPEHAAPAEQAPRRETAGRGEPRG